MSGNKQYGLQIPKKVNQTLLQKNSVFGDDSDSDKSDKGGTDWVKKSLKRSAERSNQKKQTKIDIQKALDQDATVFQYDEVYDQMEQKKQESVQSKLKERKPRYIHQLITTAEKRKIENERRIERQVQKEREAEGEEFKDKETFVTSAYKKKLEEFAKLDEEQKRQDMLEEIGDVTKQQDISGFYRHLYQTTVAPKEDNKPTEKRHKSEPSPEKSKNSSQSRKESRQYRKRKSSVSSEDKNAQSDKTSSSSSSSSSSSDSDSEGEKSSESESECYKRKRNKQTKEVALTVTESVSVPPNSEPPTESECKQKVPERSIWEKRTVGPAFDEALKRYLERKAVRMAVVH